ncbi:hypothetical protein L6654_38240 [Bradyrhizobium sp. WYCCWR 13023]|uniref:Uncharacterized protein n=1 Tax=Bradyrhizobium zhengyangense TaxID=2911009 RepID=A0A9X1RJR2_9BRAD|nr:hypothetical protein [Bradyrhizobium zhengyangense]MCG2632453.1 hypothetical protein [Bradyrhizobium zhengyangense]
MSGDQNRIVLGECSKHVLELSLMSALEVKSGTGQMYAAAFRAQSTP